jgi:hypothetical protein
LDNLCRFSILKKLRSRKQRRIIFIEIALLGVPVILLLLIVTLKRGLIFGLGWIFIPTALWMIALLIARKVSSSYLVQRVIYTILALAIFYWFFP